VISNGRLQINEIKSETGNLQVPINIWVMSKVLVLTDATTGYNCYFFYRYDKFIFGKK